MNVPIFHVDDSDCSPEEYASLWGCDPAYDKPPRLPGDGYLFYNFGVEKDDPEFLRKFIPAIERTLEEIKTDQSLDVADMETFLEYVRDLFQIVDRTCRRIVGETQ